MHWGGPRELSEDQRSITAYPYVEARCGGNPVISTTRAMATCPLHARVSVGELRQLSRVVKSSEHVSKPPGEKASHGHAPETELQRTAAKLIGLAGQALVPIKHLASRRTKDLQNVAARYELIRRIELAQAQIAQEYILAARLATMRLIAIEEEIVGDADNDSERPAVSAAQDATEFSRRIRRTFKFLDEDDQGNGS